MSVSHSTFFSESLGRSTDLSILLPEVGTAPFPVIIQLHGLSENYRSWLTQSSIARYASELPIAIAFPDAGTSGYVNWQESERFHRQGFESLIARDIPNYLRRHFRVTDSNWGIGGHSMGGYGAMRLGLKHPDLFRSIWTHSAAFHINDDFATDLLAPGPPEDLSVFELASLRSRDCSTQTISFDCGIDDERIIYNRSFDKHLFEIGLDHRYEEHPGEHTWDYWDTHIRSALAQHARVLRDGHG